MKLFKCSACGYIHEGEEAPETCPKCGAGKESFAVMSEEDSNKVYDSDRTNDIHMEIICMAMRIAELADEGIEIGLDPNCVNVFTKAKDQAWVLKGMCKAELAGHASKGKW